MMMMKKFILLTTLLYISLVFSQVGIGITTPEATLHIDPKFNTNKNTPASYYDDVVFTKDGLLGVGTKSPKTRLDLRSDENLNELGIGTTNQTAAAAKAGALRYNPQTADLSYSDATNWIRLAHKEVNDFVDVSNSSQQNFSNNATTTITNWTKNTDVNNSFTASTGIFKASKNGIYIVTFNYTLASSTIASNTRIEAIIQTNSNVVSTIKSFKCVNSFPGNNNIANKLSGACSGVFNINAGDQISVALKNELGATKKLDIEASVTSLNIIGL